MTKPSDSEKISNLFAYKYISEDFLPLKRTELTPR
jgi:hypothetical protein